MDGEALFGRPSLEIWGHDIWKSGDTIYISKLLVAALRRRTVLKVEASGQASITHNFRSDSGAQ